MFWSKFKVLARQLFSLAVFYIFMSGCFTADYMVRLLNIVDAIVWYVPEYILPVNFKVDSCLLILIFYVQKSSNMVLKSNIITTLYF